MSFTSREISARRARWNSRRLSAFDWTSEATRSAVGAVCVATGGNCEGRSRRTEEGRRCGAKERVRTRAAGAHRGHGLELLDARVAAAEDPLFPLRTESSAVKRS